MKDTRDPLTWVAAFLTFMAAKVDHKETQELATYGLLIIQLAPKHGGLWWTTYDSLFRQQAAAGSDAVWMELNPSLMAATVLSGGEAAGCTCTWCFNADHSSRDCALASF